MALKGKYIIDAEILGMSGKNRYRLKVSILDLGIHVMGMIVQPSKIEGEDWYVTTPAHQSNGKYYHDVTFDKNKPLWKEVEAACIECVEQRTED